MSLRAVIDADPESDRYGEIVAAVAVGLTGFDRGAWPHGAAGPARPHGAVFSRVGGR